MFADSLASAKKYTATNSGFESSSDEKALQEKRAYKRIHPVGSILEDFNHIIKVFIE